MRIKGKATAVKPICASWLSVVLAGWLSLMAASPAEAELYEHTFGAEVFYIDGFVSEPWDGVHIGSIIEFSYIFDSEAEDHSQSAYTGFYYLESATVSVDGHPQMTTVGDILVDVDRQWYQVVAEDLPLNGAIDMDLWGTYGALETDDIPLFLDLEDFPSRGITAIGPGWTIVSHVDTFSSEVVPTPPAAIILIGALAALRRRPRQ